MTTPARRVDRARISTREMPGLALIVAALAVLPAGCAPGSRAQKSTNRDLARALDGSSGREMSGFSLVRLLVPAKAGARKEALGGILERGLATRADSTLSANGFTLLRCKADQLPQIVEAFGGTWTIERIWLGTPYAWTELSTVPVARGMPIFVAGKLARTEEALIDLDMRAWCFPTVDSAMARVELRLIENLNSLDGIAIDPSAVRAKSRSVRDGEATIELARDEMLLILETPPAESAGEDGDGPLVPIPPTLATLLLDASPLNDRVTLLVIAPSFGDMLPPADATPGAQNATPGAQNGAPRGDNAASGASEP